MSNIFGAFDRPAGFDPELFWSWNGRLNRARLLHQLAVFHKWDSAAPTFIPVRVSPPAFTTEARRGMGT